VADTGSESGTSVEYLYKEYVRLSERCVSYVQSSFDDIKLFGASGLVFAWKPVVDSPLVPPANRALVLFYGFLAILLVVIILAIFNLLRQSLVIYYLRHVREYEATLKATLGFPGEAIFHWSDSYSRWRTTIVERVFVRLLMVVFGTIIVFPTIVLALQEPQLYAMIYGGLSLLLVGVYLSAARLLLRER